MSKVTMKVAELSGSALDYAVDRAIHGERYSERLSLIRTAGDSFRPSSSWSKCGLLLENYQIFLEPPHDVHRLNYGEDGKPKGCWETFESWHATVSTRVAEKPPVNDVFQSGGPYRGEGENPQQAICRAIASIGGDEIEIPKELLKQGGAS
ncbi:MULTISPECIES: DUF2591 family protein [Citrobacter]|uniref:DUF2591 domain-containing protein n=1 Tax=Citrobacter freundii TaxID=546 RepID=A0AA40TJA3_CITFR|nr:MULTISPECIES: DUF2591 family protein [Citrobacter]KPR53904.1 hypothetical protein AN672_18515 [Citrobacter freundii]MDM3100043.1 DUF2591 family protein [Citrobacter sp. Cf140]MEB1122472.1 DUF2591 family protein [Citrobacter freundii]HAU5660026.1 DUF2591 domain-containing protein [Citrobacter freundii]HBV7900260.1 DUF2591 family protein [Citrobacter freundii]